MKNYVVSQMDIEYLELIRTNISIFIKNCAKHYDKTGLLLDIAPQDHEGASPYFKNSTVYTLDIDPSSNATYIADICSNNSNLIENNKFDYLVCTEVLEHTLNPFDAVNEIYRILKPGGLLFLSVPFNFRIHGPLPDCWRFTEHGLRSILNKFEILELNSLDTVDRFLMPIHYTLVAKK